MEIIKREKFKDKEGEKERIILENKVESVQLLKPSKKYEKEVLKPLQKSTLRRQRLQEKEEAIQRKMREMAERELKKEGKI